MCVASLRGKTAAPLQSVKKGAGGGFAVAVRVEQESDFILPPPDREICRAQRRVLVRRGKFIAARREISVFRDRNEKVA